MTFQCVTIPRFIILLYIFQKVGMSDQIAVFLHFDIDRLKKPFEFILYKYHHRMNDLLKFPDSLISGNLIKFSMKSKFTYRRILIIFKHNTQTHYFF